MLSNSAILGILSVMGLGNYTALDGYVAAGVGTHEWRQPVGKFGLEAKDLVSLGKFGSVGLVVEHVSSIPDDSDGYGLNHLGPRYRHPSGIYGGVSYHSKSFDTKKIDVPPILWNIGYEYELSYIEANSAGLEVGMKITF